jgi:hypothetical protein
MAEEPASTVDGLGGVETSGSHTEHEGTYYDKGMFIFFECDWQLVTADSILLQEKLLVEGREEFVGKWDALLAEQANMASVASEVTPAMQQLVQSVNDLFKEEGLDLGELWLEAISEADRIQNQPASEAPGQLA